MKKILKNKKGFTLVELIVVIAILGILAVVMVPQFTKYISKANDANDLSAAKAFCTAYQAAYADSHGDATDFELAMKDLGYTNGSTAPTFDNVDIATPGKGVCEVSATN